MKFKKTMLAVAAVGAVTASAVPAMALENEFHGMYRLRGFISNFDDSAAGPVAIGNQPGSKDFGKNAPTYSYVEQRARLMYIAKANDNLRLVTHFELDSRFGDTSYNANAVNPALTGTTTTVSSATRNGGGGIGADQTNLETKDVFLEFKIPSTPVTVKAGIQGFTDNYKGIIFNNDAAGVVANAKFGAGSVQGAWFRFDDATTGNTYLGVTNATPATTVTNATVGYNTRDFATVGGKFNVSNTVTVGADYYLLYSDVLRHTQDKTYVHMIGANAEAKIGPATVNGFAIYQFGELGLPFVNAAGVPSAVHTHQDISAFAGNVAAKMAVGPGTAKLTALLVTGDHNTGGTGDRNDFQTIMERGATTSGHTFYESGSMLLLRNIQASDKTDRAVIFDLNNNGRGTIVGFAGYDLLLGKFFMNSNVGVGAVQKDNRNAQTGGSRYGSGSSNVLGTEINTEIGYKVYDNMTASVQGAYLALGDYYSRPGGKPENPYSTRIVLNYVF
jgi:hypothetical protein